MVAGAGIVLCTLGSIGTVYYISRGNRVEELRRLMSSTLQQAESILAEMEGLHRQSAFDTPSMLKTLDPTRVQESAYYKSIPVVASWNTVRRIAKERGFDFYTPTRPGVPARNPANALREYDAVFAAFERGEREYFGRSPDGKSLVLARPVYLQRGCLACHGSGGKDALGYAMEGLQEGDLKGAFILQTPISDDPVVRASMVTISVSGMIVLFVVVVIFSVLLRRLVTAPLEQVALGLRCAAGRIRSDSDTLAATGQQLSDGATNQAASLTETAASTTEITAIAESGAKDTQAAAGLMNDAVHAAENAQSDLQELETAMQGILAASSRIATIIKTVDEIAGATEMLALNASVEAARAGEAGLSFGVVANQVRALSKRCVAAANDTAELVQNSIHQSKTGAERLHKVTETVVKLTDIAHKAGAALGQVSAAAAEQSQGVSQISSEVVRMERYTQELVMIAASSAEAGRKLHVESAELEDSVHVLEAMLAGQEVNASGPPPASSPGRSATPAGTKGS
jgi:hypothetical protein